MLGIAKDFSAAYSFAVDRKRPAACLRGSLQDGDGGRGGGSDFEGLGWGASDVRGVRRRLLGRKTSLSAVWENAG